jgi:hypothetical protein
MNLELAESNVVFRARKYRIRGEEIADKTPSETAPNLLDL